MSRAKNLDRAWKYLYPKCTRHLWTYVLKDNATSDHTLLEVGSGSGVGNQNQLYPDVKKIIGIDLDERILANPHLSKAHHMSAYEISPEIIKDEADLIFSQMVAEHIDDPEAFIKAQLSVLKKDGVIVHSTVSKHYWASLINNSVPIPLKNWFIKHLGWGRGSEDVFPAHYKLNSERQIAALSKVFDLDYEVIRQDGPPGYFSRSFILILLYSIIHKPLQFCFPVMRPTFIFVLRRK
jgi:SAM-dependent methyltransferase